ncbi:MAG: DNA adenine methylase [Firmicutes bacterium]|nr:DNA adenine methylase [Bacillota bacterium]
MPVKAIDCEVPVLWPWLGGKARLARWIAGRLPPHRCYVEPFAGTAAVLLAKAPAPLEVLNDANGDLVAVYRCLQDPGQARRLYRRLRHTPISRLEWERAHEPADDPVERAARFLVRQLQGFGGKPDASTWGGGLGDNLPDRLATTLRRWRAAQRRLRGVVLECGDWRAVVDRYERPDTLVYADPPYLTDDPRDAYGVGRFGPAEHAALVERLLAYEGLAVVSGYPHPLYERLEAAGWVREARRVSVNVLGRTMASGLAGGRLGEEHYRADCLWWSPRAWRLARRQLRFDDLGEEAWAGR